MKVNHGSGDVGMAQQLFQGYNIDSLFQQMCGVRVAQQIQTFGFYYTLQQLAKAT